MTSAATIRSVSIAGRLAGIAFLCGTAIFGGWQTSLPPDLQKQEMKQQEGLENAWDVRAILDHLSKDDQQLASILAALKPQQWADQKGAPTPYILQWQQTQQQTRDVAVVEHALMQQTDNLSLGLDLYFRLEALDITARSLSEGASKYADRPTAENLKARLAQNFTDRERLRDYLKDLATSTQQNFKIADAEAQRCRGMISKEPPKTVRK